MQSSIKHDEDGASGVTRRAFRLLVLLGLGVAAYVVLSLFDHAARADTGSTDQLVGQIVVTDPGASVKAATTGVKAATSRIKVTTSGVKKAARKPKSANLKSADPKSAAPKAQAKTTNPPTIKTPRVKVLKAQASKKLPAPKIRAAEVKLPNVQTPKKLPALKIQKPAKIGTSTAPALETISALNTRTGETAQLVQARTSRLRQGTSDVVQRAARASADPARATVVRETLLTSARPPSLPELAVLPDLPRVAAASLTRLLELPQAGLPALPQLPSWPQLLSWPQLPGLPAAQLIALPPLSSSSQLLGLPMARTQVSTRTAELLSAPASHLPVMRAAATQACSRSAAFTATGLSGVTKPPAAQARPGTAPLPGPPRQPGDQSTTTGQASGSGGGNAPAMGTVSSSWRPEVTAAGLYLATDVIARGRTVRYAGPPS